MKISFINANDEIFEITGNYILGKDWSGFGEINVDHKTEKAPYQDGETYIDTILGTKDIVIPFLIKGSTRQSVFDRRLIVQKAFNPKLGLGKLVWEQDDGTEYYIDCLPFSPIFPGGKSQGKWYQQVIIRFLAPNPYWYNPTQIQEILIGFSGGLQFNWSFPISFGQVGSSVIVNNLGNVETPVLIYIYGEVVDPIITNNTTDESIEIVGTVNDGDILIINTAFGEKGALLLSDGEYTNVFQMVDPDSTFWYINPGLNNLSYTVTSEGENAECRVMFYYRYSGV